MLPVRKTHHLPIVFQPLDLHGVTKPVPTVVCPTRGEVLTVGTCGACGEFRRIDFTHDGHPVVSCATRAVDEPPAPDDPDLCEAQSVLRVPHVCAGPDTTISDVLSYVARRRTQDVIPVLDMSARPVGLVTCDEIVQLFKCGADPRTPLSAFMNLVFARVKPHTRLREAAALRPAGPFRGVVVVGNDQTFLGLVAASELPEAC
jgi:hypothetical protein